MSEWHILYNLATRRHRRFLKPLNVPTNDDTTNVADTTIAQVDPNNASTSDELRAPDIPTGKLTEQVEQRPHIAVNQAKLNHSPYKS